MRGLTRHEREVLRLMSLHRGPNGEVTLPVPDMGTETVLRDLTAQGRALNWYTQSQDGTWEHWSISLQGLEALRLVPETIPEVT